MSLPLDAKEVEVHNARGEGGGVQLTTKERNMARRVYMPTLTWRCFGVSMHKCGECTSDNISNSLKRGRQWYRCAKGKGR